MKIITSKLHGILDFCTVLFFLAAPSLFALSDTGAYLSYTLAGVHLLMTIFTDFPMGWIKLIPFSTHGKVELVVSIVLVIVPWLLSDLFGEFDRIFFSVCGAVIFVVWLLSDYKSPVETTSPEI